MLRMLLQAGGRDNVATVLETTLGPYPAQIVVRGAVIVSATAGPFVGVDALLRLVLTKRHSEQQTVHQKPVPAALSSSVAAAVGLGLVDDVLADVDAQRDALQEEAEVFGGFARVATVRFASLAPLVDGLPDDVQRVVRLADGTRDIVTLLAQADLAPVVTVRVLGKLLRSGVLGDGESVREASGVVDRSWQQRQVAAAAAVIESSTPGSALPSPADALPSLGSTPIVDVRPPVTVNAAPALPAAVRHPRDAQAWLSDEHEAFFARTRAVPSSSSLSPPWIAALLIVGAVLGVLLATQCGDQRTSSNTVTRPSSAA